MKQYNTIIVGLFLSTLGLPMASADPLPWEEPIDVGELNSSDRDGTPDISSTLKEIYFDLDFEIYRSTRTSSTGVWGTPAQISQLDVSEGSDATPHLSSDGLTIWWQHNVSCCEWQIYTATRDDTDPDTLWEGAEEVTELTESGKITGSPVVSNDELTMWFNSDRSGGEGALDIWVTTRTSTTTDWATPTNEGDLNSSSQDTPGWISANELVFYMTSERDGDRDIYEVRRTSKTADWGTVTAANDLNSTADDKEPTLSTSRMLVWFGSERTGGDGGDDIWASVRPLLCDGDVNFDGTVDPLDLGFVSSRYDCDVDFTADWECFWADVNGDGEVDPLDHGYILARYGDCP